MLFGAQTHRTDPFPTQIELSSLDGTNGFVIYGEQIGDRSSYSVSDAGDVNGDGIDDFLIGARGASPSGRTQAGKTYVVFGRHVTETEASALSTSSISRTTTSPTQLENVGSSTIQDGSQRLETLPASSVDIPIPADGVGEGAVAGIAGAVAALSISIVGASVVAWYKLFKRNCDRENHLEMEMQPAIVDDTQSPIVVREYGMIPPTLQDASEHTKPPAPEHGNLSEYRRIDRQ